jgi:hypothetical protein
MVVTAVDNDNKVNLGHLSAYPPAAEGLSILQQVKRPAISTVKNPDEWAEIEITVDSGACVTVMPRSLCEGISILQNRLSREGVEYEVANGAHIPNLGERRFEMMTLGGQGLASASYLRLPIFTSHCCQSAAVQTWDLIATWVTKAGTFWTNTPVSRYLSSAERISTSCGLG